MLQIKNISLQQGNKMICENLESSLEKGQFLLIKGKNASGKSTLIHSLFGMHEPTKGQIFIDGYDIYKLDTKARQQFLNKSGIAFQMPHLRMYDTVKLAVDHHGADNIQRNRMLKFLELDTKSQTLVKNLSCSELRRLDLGRSIVHQPRLVIWDTPFLCLDEYWKKKFLQALKELKELGTTIIMSCICACDFDELKPDKIIQL